MKTSIQNEIFLLENLRGRKKTTQKWTIRKRENKNNIILLKCSNKFEKMVMLDKVKIIKKSRRKMVVDVRIIVLPFDRFFPEDLV